MKNEYFLSVVVVDDIVDYIDSLEIDLVYEDNDDQDLMDKLVNLFGIDRGMAKTAIDIQRSYQLGLQYDNEKEYPPVEWDYSMIANR